MNAKIIEGLKAVREGIDLILEGCAVTEAPTPMQEEVVESNSVKRRKEVQSEAVKTPATEPANDKDEGVANTVTREQLDGMTYNNIKKLAKEFGVSAVGNRDEITARILGTTDDESVMKEPIANAPETQEAPEEVPVDEKDNDPLYAKVVETVADMSNEEIADVLVDIGISAKGKREALIEKVVQAVKDGLLDFDDEEESEEEETVTEAPAKKKEVVESVESDDEEDDMTNDIDNPDMTEARKKAIIAQDDEIRNQFKKGEVTRKDLVEFLQSFYDVEDDMDDMSDEDLLDTYIDAVCRLVDDDGDLIEEGAYSLNGEPACCGRVLSYSEDTKMFICERCGEEYEAEE